MTDIELQRKLAALLPDKIELAAEFATEGVVTGRVYQWKYPAVIDQERIGQGITSREWLHVCWLVEQTLEVCHDGSEADNYQVALWHIANPDVTFGDIELCDVGYLHKLTTASWQQRAEALCKAKGLQ